MFLTGMVVKSSFEWGDGRLLGIQVPFTLSTPGHSVTIDQKGLSQPIELFKRPFVVEMMGAGFDKPGNVSYFALRSPLVQKVYLDRTIEDTVSFGELQEMARTTPQDDDEDRNISRVGTPQSLEQASSFLGNKSTSADSFQCSNQHNHSQSHAESERGNVKAFPGFSQIVQPTRL